MSNPAVLEGNKRVVEGMARADSVGRCEFGRDVEEGALTGELKLVMDCDGSGGVNLRISWF